MAPWNYSIILGKFWHNWGNTAQMLCVHNAFLRLTVLRMRLPLVKCGTLSQPSLEKVAQLSASIKTKPLPLCANQSRLHSGWSGGRSSYKIKRVSFFFFLLVFKNSHWALIVLYFHIMRLLEVKMLLNSTSLQSVSWHLTFSVKQWRKFTAQFTISSFQNGRTNPK